MLLFVTMKTPNVFYLFVFIFSILFGQPAKADLKVNLTPLTVNVGNEKVQMQVYGPGIVRVLKTPAKTEDTKVSLVVTKQEYKGKIETVESKEAFSLFTSKLKVTVDKKSGLVSFFDLQNKLLLSEKETNRMFVPTTDVNGASFKVKQLFGFAPGEAIYGLGQDQNGVMNYRNQEVQLKQRNMYVANPFLLSSKGYGLLWDNYSATNFTDNSKGGCFESVIGDCVDYYFIYGGSADAAIAGYRDLTGASPMYGKWVFGFWQCRERYESQEQIVGVVEKYRELQVPLDNIVQDWRYWGMDLEQWNATEFGNPSFPDPKGMIDRIHKNNAHIMISVWPSFGVETTIYKEMDRNKMLYDFRTWPNEKVRVYDAFNPKARDLYWSYMNKNIFSKGMDAWWLDATEPEQADRQGKIDSTQTALGSFKRFANAYPLQTNKGVYENQRKVSSDKRVFILTRSAFCGQQRYAASTWSGDIDGNWTVFRNQIAGGINFCLSGIPYWTTDIGGFFVRGELYPLGVADSAYQELYVRWFQFGAFSPLFRSHGTSTPREIYQFGKKGYWAYDVQEKFINLRYRLLPYIYSQAWRITSDGATMMRGLVMDFPEDVTALNIGNQYMFGPSLLVTPVTEPQYTTMGTNGKSGKSDFSKIKNTKVYLPKGVDWYDFWTGEKIEGGKTISRPTPIDILPLYVKAGSIIPFGPVVQYAAEKPAGPIELRVYEGKDAVFTLYEDENDNYNYEKGAYSLIPIRWNEKSHTLTIGKRTGSFPGMINKRVFNIVFVRGNSSTLENKDSASTYEVLYTGKSVSVKEK